MDDQVKETKPLLEEVMNRIESINKKVDKVTQINTASNNSNKPQFGHNNRRREGFSSRRGSYFSGRVDRGGYNRQQQNRVPTDEQTNRQSSKFKNEDTSIKSTKTLNK